MGMSLGMLSGRLKHMSPGVFMLKDENISIRALKLLSKDQTAFEPDILYVGKSSELPGSISAQHAVNILCLEDTPLPHEYMGSPLLNIITLKKSMDISAAFNEIQDILIKEHEVAHNSLILLEALAHESGLQRIVELGYQMLGNPFCIIDRSLKAIAVTTYAKKEDDPVWNEIVTTGYSSINTVSFYSLNKLNEMIATHELPFFWVDDYSKYPRIMGKVNIGGKQAAGVIVCAHERPYKEGDLELVSLLCNAIAVEMQKNKFIHYSRGLIYEDFIEDLLEGRIKESKVVEERIKILGLSFNKKLYVLSVDISGFDSTKGVIFHMRNELEKMLCGSKAVVYNDHIVMIASCDKEKTFFERDLKDFAEFLKDHRMVAGISRCFYNLGELREYYLQSVEALKLGALMDKEKHVFRYEDYAVYHIADLCSSLGDLKKYCHPSLLALMEHDRQNNTNYTQSLYTYIVNSKNLAESANALHIHRNTMIYRIEKIEEIMNVDLNDSNTLLHLHLSFKMLEFDDQEGIKKYWGSYAG
ncbi:MAG: helix-turn-helix domain-containing protein [Clostridiales bacterium]|jgi:sugar diacid utilization regulator|nr:helix-turn-helix domain-containing protein [Eubacteriales bacterium]MDH7565996.1 helix-turn-helix domain-containing protein [Clostridiales bacterium]